jgi:putative spermidine/putrescine transport system permease protein
MELSRPARIALRTTAAIGFAIIYIPLLLVLVNSLNIDRTFSWPPSGVTLRWWGDAWNSVGARDALWTSVRAGLGATAIALVLGTLIAFAVQRYTFFGRESLSFLVVLPIALPGIVTGVALNTAFRAVLGPRRPRALHRDRRPRHLLHRRGLQQRGRPIAPVVRLV